MYRNNVILVNAKQITTLESVQMQDYTSGSKTQGMLTRKVDETIS